MPDFFEQDEYWRRKERIAAAEEQNAVRLRQDAEAAAKRQIEADKLTARANESFLLHEYRSYGIDPPFVDLGGMPTVSLALLLDMGWRVEQVGRESTLVRPLHDTTPRKRREDYDQSS